MKPNSSKSVNPDRYLVRRGRRFYYKRYVPTEIQELDDRAPYVCQALKTEELFIARQQHDILEEADNHYWASLILNADNKIAKHPLYGRASIRKVPLDWRAKITQPIKLPTLEYG